MTMTKQEVQERCTKVIAEQFGLLPSDIKPESDIFDDLNADSLDTVELVMALEDEFIVEIEDGRAEECNTVRLRLVQR